MLATFYWAIDVLGWRTIAFPLTVAGMNSIALYIMSQLMRNSTADALERHFGSGVFKVFGDAYVPLVKANLVLLVFWLFVWCNGSFSGSEQNSSRPECCRCARQTLQRFAGFPPVQE
jgi:predicted acyltransferase